MSFEVSSKILVILLDRSESIAIRGFEDLIDVSISDTYTETVHIARRVLTDYEDELILSKKHRQRFNNIRSAT